MGLVLIVVSAMDVVVFIPECTFVARGYVVVAIWALAGGDGDLDEVSIAICRKTGSAKIRRQAKRAARPLGEHALGIGRPGV